MVSRTHRYELSGNAAGSSENILQIVLVTTQVLPVQRGCGAIQFPAVAVQSARCLQQCVELHFSLAARNGSGIHLRNIWGGGREDV